MENIKHWREAYLQAPWRRQVQGISLFLAGLVLAALIAGAYLHVTAQAVTMGNEIQNMQREISALKRINENLESQLAYLTASYTMAERAREMGFRPISAGRIIYVSVPGYPGRKPATLAPPPDLQVVSAPVLAPEYTESLVDWVMANILTPSGMLAGEKP